MRFKEYLKMDNENAPKTQEEFYDYCDEDNYNFKEQLNMTRETLRNKHEEYHDDIEFYKDVLQEYAHEVIPLLLEDYKDILSEEILGNLKAIPNNIYIIGSKDSKGRHEGYCYQRKDIYFVPERIEKNPIEKALIMKGVLLHEIHHVITSNLKQTNQHVIQTCEDTIIKNHYGNYLDEGMVEKSALFFAKKHNLFITPCYGYISNVKLLEFIMKKLNIDNPCELWNRPYDEILSNPIFDKEYLVEYNQFEEEYMIRYTLGTEKYQKWKEKQQLLKQREQLQKAKHSNQNKLENESLRIL